MESDKSLFICISRSDYNVTARCIGSIVPLSEKTKKPQQELFNTTYCGISIDIWLIIKYNLIKKSDLSSVFAQFG